MNQLITGPTSHHLDHVTKSVEQLQRIINHKEYHHHSFNYNKKIVKIIVDEETNRCEILSGITILGILNLQSNDCFSPSVITTHGANFTAEDLNRVNQYALDYWVKKPVFVITLDNLPGSPSSLALVVFPATLPSLTDLPLKSLTLINPKITNDSIKYLNCEDEDEDEDECGEGDEDEIQEEEKFKTIDDYYVITDEYGQHTQYKFGHLFSVKNITRINMLPQDQVEGLPHAEFTFLK